MTAVALVPVWRVPPPTYPGWTRHDLHMCDGMGVDCSIPADGCTRGEARALFAGMWSEPFTSIRVQLRRLVWDPLTAAIEWRESRCDDWSWLGGGCCTPSGYRVAPENCLCPWPEDIHGFWDEDGIYCPWRPPMRGEAHDVAVWWGSVVA